jgi:hypothetical protein
MSGRKIQIFGIKHGGISTEAYKEELDEFLSEDTSVLYLEPSSETESIFSILFSKATLWNPSLVLMLALRSLWSQRPWRSHSNVSEWEAAREVAKERDIDSVKVGGSQAELINSVSPHWWPLSWVLFILSIYFLFNNWVPLAEQVLRVGKEGVPELIGAISGWLLLLALFSILIFFIAQLVLTRPFIRTTRPHRDIALLENAKNHWVEEGHNNICIVVGAGHIDSIDEIVTLSEAEIVGLWDIREDRD